MLAWARAAGGTVQDGEAPAVTLPADLQGLAAAELRTQARMHGVAVEVQP